nr:MAG TPA: hypothetical protein [Caudoviricetes sp.]
MSNDEMKKKIAKICAREYDEWVEEDYARRIVKIDFDKLADVLIAAGIGDVAALTDKWREMLRVQAEKTEQAERRARIAEFALYRSFGPHSYGFELQRAEQILSESGELAEEKKEP